MTSDDEDNIDVLLHPSDDIDIDDELGVTFAGWILMQSKHQWIKHLHDNSNAGYILLLHPVIFDYSKSNIIYKDNLAVEWLITNLSQIILLVMPK